MDFNFHYLNFKKKSKKDFRILFFKCFSKLFRLQKPGRSHSIHLLSIQINIKALNFIFTKLRYRQFMNVLFRLNLQKHFEFLQQILSSFREKTQQFLSVTRNLERKWHLRPICGLRRERRFMLLMTLSSTLFFTLKLKSISFFVEPA